MDWSSVVTGLAIGILFILYFTFRKPMGFASVAEINRAVLSADGNPDDIMNAVIVFACDAKYKIGERDDDSNMVVIEEGMSLFNYGALFQVAIKPEGAGRSAVHVAIVGRGFQWGPAFHRSKRRFLDGLQAALADMRAPVS